MGFFFIRRYRSDWRWNSCPMALGPGEMGEFGGSGGNGRHEGEIRAREAQARHLRSAAEMPGPAIAVVELGLPWPIDTAAPSEWQQGRDLHPPGVYQLE
jgi:hypothetical protein